MLEKTEKRQQVASAKRAANSRRQPAPDETSVNHETIIIDPAFKPKPAVAKQAAKPAKPAAQETATANTPATSTTSVPVKSTTKTKLAGNSQTPGRTRQQRPNIAVVSAVQDDENEETEQAPFQLLRVVPSWLSSLFLHLSVILILALLSVSNGGRSSVELSGGTVESVNIDPSAAFELVVESEEIETSTEQLDTLESNFTEDSQLAAVLDEALLSAVSDIQSDEKLFEQLTASGGDLNPTDVTGENAKFFGIEEEGSDFVFIIDCSDSMNYYGRWKLAVEELKRSIKELKPNQRFLILLYNSGYIAMNNKLKMVKSTDAQRRKAVRWLNSKTPFNATFCAAALREGLSLKPSAIFLLSDGEFNDRDRVFEVLRNLNSSKSASYAKVPSIPVHTVALGSHVGRFTMERIAQENRGEFKLIE